MLEVVGIDFAALGDEVGLNILSKFNNFQINTLFSQNVFRCVQDLGVGRGGGGDLQGRTGQLTGLGGGLGSRGRSSRALGGCGDGISRSGGAAGGQRQGQRSGERCRNQFFHGKFSFIYRQVCWF